MSSSGLVLLHTARTQRVPVDATDVYLLEAAGDRTLVRLRSKDPTLGLRPLGELSPLFEPETGSSTP